MSDTYISIVPIDKQIHKDSKAIIRLKEFLIKREIIDQDLKPSRKVNDSIKEDNFVKFDNSRLEIVQSRQVFDSGSNDLESINCPNCGFNVIESDWMDKIEEWYSNSDSQDLVCPNCGTKTRITNYSFSPTWAFGELGFIFWNWGDLSNEFIDEIEKTLLSKVTIVKGRI